jgi:glycosyltransferase involved in cell wall biosynthesis
MEIAFLNSLISRSAGGVFEVQRRLAQNLIQIPNVKVKIFGSEDEHTEEDLDLWQPLRPIVHKTKGPLSFCYAPGLIKSLKNSGSELIHLHVLWLYPSIASLRSNLPYITTTHGMLDTWALRNSTLKKKLVAFFYERAALNKASCLHAFTKQEYFDIRNFGLKNPVCILPNGVDIPSDILGLKANKAVWNGTIEDGKKVLLYLGRIHPKKGLTNLIKAWKTVQENNKGLWVLAIIGWNQGGYEAELKELSRNLGLEKTVFFLGPQFNKNKDLSFAHADAFILPSFSEGLPMAVLEAWAYTLPVVMTKQCNLPEGFQQNAAIEIDTSIESIANGLSQLFSSSKNDLQQMGNAGNKLVIEKFNWKTIAREMHKTYKWILEKGQSPDNVILK